MENSATLATTVETNWWQSRASRSTRPFSMIDPPDRPLRSSVVDPEPAVDHFRKLRNRPNPVVGFLSHVHSDHLQGLESWGKIPLYCSPTTRELLLRLEKYPHRMNLAKGILECKKQTYKALKSILKPIPLNTPTEVELGPDRSIRVTLLDANHCAGAVMFLIEYEQRAILYTGDVRSETWWVNSLIRNPIIIPYTLGNKRLDRMYLDTTFASEDERYRTFQSKAAGIKELLEKVSKYPEDTIFHFHAWTLGYEDVWIALSSALKTQVHVDEYKYRLYASLSPENPSQFQCQEGPALFGFKNGNRLQLGCLTGDQAVRLHSCEHGTGCPALSASSTVYITPIINRGNNGEVLPEVGAGGVGGDLLQSHGYLELSDHGMTEMLIGLCDERVKDPMIRSNIRDIIIKTLGSDDKVISLDAIGLWDSKGDVKLDQLVDKLGKLAESGREQKDVTVDPSFANDRTQSGDLPGRIQFPYSRHSSYEELCELVAAFRPRDIYPCTTDWREWSWDVSMENLFGPLCSGDIFDHDLEMAGFESERAISRIPKTPRTLSESQQTMSSEMEASESSRMSAGGAEEFADTGSQGKPQTAQVEGLRCAKRRIGELRHSFERPLEAVKRQNCLNDPASNLEQLNSRLSARSYNGFSPQPRDRNLKGPAPHHSLPTKRPAGTQAEPIELSDDGTSKHNSQAQGSFSLNDLSEREEHIESGKNEQSALETQLTLSDEAFESQLSALAPEKREVQMQHRKQAYKAAQDLSGAWAEDQGLVSSGAGHGDEEVEL